MLFYEQYRRLPFRLGNDNFEHANYDQRKQNNVCLHKMFVDAEAEQHLHRRRHESLEYDTSNKFNELQDFNSINKQD